MQVLPWLEANCSLAVARIQAGEEAVHRSKENRRLRYQGLPRNIHRYTTWVVGAYKCCLCGIFILDRDFYPFRIADLRSRIPDLTTTTKEEGETFFLARNLQNLKLFQFWTGVKNNLSQLTQNCSTFYPKRNCH